MKIIGLTGLSGAGKDSLCEIMGKYDGKRYYVGQHIKNLALELAKEEGLTIVTPEHETKARYQIREKYGKNGLAIMSVQDIKENYQNSLVFIDSVGSKEEKEIYQREFGNNLICLAIVADKNIQEQRLTNRELRPLNKMQMEEKDRTELELGRGTVIGDADYFILNNSNNIKDLEIKCKEFIGTISL